MNDYLGSMEARLADAGVSKTVYALVTPEIEEVFDKVLDGGLRRELLAGFDQDSDTIAKRFHDAREPLRDLYREPWTRKQDDLHLAFFETWRRWSKPVLGLEEALFPYQYPTAGASEALRAVIDDYGNKARVEGFAPKIHIFRGEYEGYAAYAAAAGIPVVIHDRENWSRGLEKVGPADQFYISQPSAIDGSVWPDFDAFARQLYELQPAAALMLDLTYVGCVARRFRVCCEYPNIQTLFFSLSKPAGVYYHRIGGCLSRTPCAGLTGNIWFKNLLSLRLGVAFMEAFHVHALPRLYQPIQKEAASAASEALGLSLQASAVGLLATATPCGDQPDLEKIFLRGGRKLRFCLTPGMSALIQSQPRPKALARCA